MKKANYLACLISKGRVRLYEQVIASNVNIRNGNKVSLSAPSLHSVQGRIVGQSIKGGKVVRLVLTGKNFASRIVSVGEKVFVAKPYRTNSVVSFGNNSNIEILKVRTLTNGTRILLTLRATDVDFSNVPITVQTTPSFEITYRKRAGF